MKTIIIPAINKDFVILRKEITIDGKTISTGKYIILDFQHYGNVGFTDYDNYNDEEDDDKQEYNGDIVYINAKSDGYLSEKWWIPYDPDFCMLYTVHKQLEFNF